MNSIGQAHGDQSQTTVGGVALRQGHLRQLPYRDGIVYGPIISRRLGRSLGINLLPLNEKVCSFDCLYCQFPRAARPASWHQEAGCLPSATIVTDEIERAFLHLAARSEHCDSVTFSGNGDASVYPEFAKVACHVRCLRDELFPAAALSIFTNGLAARDVSFREALRLFDNVFLKVDAGDDVVYRRINRSQSRLKLEEIVGLLAGTPGLVFQTMVVGGALGNIASLRDPGFEDLVRLAKPRRIDLYTIDKRPAYSCAVRVSVKKLQWLAERLGERLPVPVEVHFADCTSGFPDDPRLDA